MIKFVNRAFLLLLLMTLLTGIFYPLAVTGMAKALFSRQASGSLVFLDGKPIGSALIGQDFTDPKYFHGRPSAAGANGCDATASGGSNLGPASRTFLQNVARQADAVRDENYLRQKDSVPADLVTASASGLDPHISPEAALIQVHRVAQVRQLPEQEVRQLVEQHIIGPQLGMLGESRVNVLLLNLDLDKKEMIK
ncbi:MAG: Potassium-transporting ATPase C chain [Pelotomaculum sp. PtaU1.Bin035]|nr:MAG: Potassium-transporting ATPase C chain [Pelotomaculum sp. PtaU1.Bin035]